MIEHEARAREIAEKLTRPQRNHLADFAADDTPTAACMEYRPFLKLWDLDLVTRANGRWRGGYFVATPLGRLVAAEIARMEARET